MERLREFLKKLIETLPAGTIANRLRSPVSSTDIIANLMSAHAWAVEQFDNLLSGVLSAKEEEFKKQVLYTKEWWKDKMLNYQQSSGTHFSENSFVQPNYGNFEFSVPGVKIIKGVTIEEIKISNISASLTGVAVPIIISVFTTTAIAGQNEAEVPSRLAGGLDAHNKYTSLLHYSTFELSLIYEYINLLKPIGVPYIFISGYPSIITEMRISLEIEKNFIERNPDGTIASFNIEVDEIKELIWSYLEEKIGGTISVTDIESRILTLKEVVECEIIRLKLAPRYIFDSAGNVNARNPEGLLGETETGEEIFLVNLHEPPDTRQDKTSYFNTLGTGYYDLANHSIEIHGRDAEGDGMQIYPI